MQEQPTAVDDFDPQADVDEFWDEADDDADENEAQDTPPPVPLTDLDYEQAEEVKVIAEELIEEHHNHLINCNIAYLFRTSSWTSKGRTVEGKAYRMSGREKALTGLEFAIVINKDIYGIRSSEKREAMIDHQLSHCLVTHDGKCKIVHHDFEGFGDVIRRHGMWKDDLERAGEAFGQLHIDDLGAEEAAE